MIRKVKASDANEITNIYNYFIRETVITFEEEEITSDEMLVRIDKIANDGFPWFVALDENNKLIGYAYATKWRERFAYRFSVEVAVYLDPVAQGKGVGSEIFGVLLKELKSRGIKRALGAITIPNEASAALHEKFGFKKVAHFDKVGLKFGEWLDVGFWQGDV